MIKMDDLNELRDLIQKIGVKVDFTSQESGQTLKEVFELEKKYIQNNKILITDRLRINDLENKYEALMMEWSVSENDRMQLDDQLNELKEQVKKLEDDVRQLYTKGSPYIPLKE